METNNCGQEINEEVEVKACEESVEAPTEKLDTCDEVVENTTEVAEVCAEETEAGESDEPIDIQSFSAPPTEEAAEQPPKKKSKVKILLWILIPTFLAAAAAVVVVILLIVVILAAIFLPKFLHKGEVKKSATQHSVSAVEQSVESAYEDEFVSQEQNVEQPSVSENTTTQKSVSQLLLSGACYEYGYQDFYANEWVFYSDGTCTRQTRFPEEEANREISSQVYSVEDNTVTIYEEYIYPDGEIEVWETVWEYDRGADCFWRYFDENGTKYKIKIFHHQEKLTRAELDDSFEQNVGNYLFEIGKVEGYNEGYSGESDYNYDYAGGYDTYSFNYDS